MFHQHNHSLSNNWLIFIFGMLLFQLKGRTMISAPVHRLTDSNEMNNGMIHKLMAHRLVKKSKRLL